jgi:hypothetical protein
MKKQLNLSLHLFNIARILLSHLDLQKPTKEKGMHILDLGSSQKRDRHIRMQ